MTIDRQPYAGGPSRTDVRHPVTVENVRLTRHDNGCRTGPQQEEFEKMRDKKRLGVSKAVRA